MGIKRAKVGVVGCGVVGGAVAQMFDYPHYELESGVVIYDKHRNIGTPEAINSCDAAFVCVPTPARQNGRCDTSIVEEVVGWLTTPLIIIKSTVEPGTTKRLQAQYPDKHIIFSPEFTGQGDYYSPYEFQRDMIKSDYFIFGGYTEDTSRAIEIYLPVAGPSKQYIQCDPTAAEMCKYVVNSYLSLKVAFTHEIASICRINGIDWNTVRELWLLDPRVTRSHTAIFPGKPAAITGTCFPKDLAALISWSDASYHGFTTLCSLLASATPLPAVDTNSIYKQPLQSEGGSHG